MAAEKITGRSVMDERVQIRGGQWLTGPGPIYADCGGEECLVWLDSEVANHPSLDQMPERPSMTANRDALDRASAAATRAKARGSIDSYNRIAVFLRDLKPEN